MYFDIPPFITNNLYRSNTGRNEADEEGEDEEEEVEEREGKKDGGRLVSWKCVESIRQVNDGSKSGKLKR